MADQKIHEEMAREIFIGFVRDFHNDGFYWETAEEEAPLPDYGRMREAAWDAAEAFYGFL